MRILNVHKYYWPRDGASKYALGLAELLTGNGNEVVPFSMDNPENIASTYQRFFVSNANMSDPRAVSFPKKIQSAGRMFYSFEAKKKLTALLKEEKINVAHLHNIYHHISPAILPVFKKNKIPVVMTLHDYKLLAPNHSLFHHGAVHEEDAHGWYGSCVKNKCHKDSRAQSLLVTAEMIWHHKIMKYYERLVDHFIAPSQFMFDLCTRFGWPQEKFSYIPNPVFGEPELTPSSGAQNYIGYIGHLSEEKGVRVLLAAALATPTIQYKIFGTGGDENYLRDFLVKYSMSNVELAGFKTGAGLIAAIQGARILVAPSIWYENAPYSILEPLSAGKVVLGSCIGGIPELLPRKLLVEAGNVAAWANAITEWFHKPAEEINKWGSVLRADILARRNSGEHARQIQELYAKLRA